MFNRVRTSQVFGYDIDPEVRRRTKDDILTSGSKNKKELIVVDNCPICGIERQIKYRASLKNRPCSKCFHNSLEMLAIKKAQKGKIVSEESKQKMKDNHWSKHGYISGFKGQHHKDETKEKLRNAYFSQFQQYDESTIKEFYEQASCTVRNIDRSEFAGFVSPENTRIRQSPEGKAWSYDVLAKSNFTCIKCGERGGSLRAHHLNAFASYPEQRFDIENGVCLCGDCHDKFHTLYGKGNNTKEQFDEWLSKSQIENTNLKTIYMLCGASGSGKSWVAKQLLDKFQYVSFDDTPKKDHLNLLHACNTDKPILYDPTIKISTFIKRHSSEFNIIPVFIIESEDVIKERIAKRGGKWTEHIPKRMKVMEARNIKYGVFSGTAVEVLDWLKNNI